MYSFIMFIHSFICYVYFLLISLAYAFSLLFNLMLVGFMNCFVDMNKSWIRGSVYGMLLWISLIYYHLLNLCSSDEVWALRHMQFIDCSINSVTFSCHHVVSCFSRLTWPTEDCWTVVFGYLWRPDETCC